MREKKKERRKEIRREREKERNEESERKREEKGEREREKERNEESERKSEEKGRERERRKLHLLSTQEGVTVKFRIHSKSSQFELSQTGKSSRTHFRTCSSVHSLVRCILDMNF